MATSDVARHPGTDRGPLRRLRVRRLVPGSQCHAAAALAVRSTGIPHPLSRHDRGGARRERLLQPLSSLPAIRRGGGPHRASSVRPGNLSGFTGTRPKPEARRSHAVPALSYRTGDAGAKEYRTSLLFDPDWYREHYPEAARAVGRGQYRSLLEHYLRNDRPTEFDPSPWFSETHYLAENPGLAESIGPDGFRNGFAHFLAFGLHEGRSPHPELDLAWHAGPCDVAADIAAQRAQNAFAHWITIGYHGRFTWPGSRLKIRVTEPQAIALYRRRANIIWPLFGRHKLDFTLRQAPLQSA